MANCRAIKKKNPDIELLMSLSQIKSHGFSLFLFVFFKSLHLERSYFGFFFWIVYLGFLKCVLPLKKKVSVRHVVAAFWMLLASVSSSVKWSWYLDISEVIFSSKSQILWFSYTTWNKSSFLKLIVCMVCICVFKSPIHVCWFILSNFSKYVQPALQSACIVDNQG